MRRWAMGWMLWALAAVWAGRAADNWDDAQRLFSTSRYREAAVVLEREAQASPASAAVWFNLGQARFQAGELGLARVAWERAARLDPRDPEIRAALGLARGRAPSDEVPGWSAALGRLTPEEWAVAWLGSALLLGAGLAAGRTGTSGVRWFQVGTALAHVATGLLWLAAMVSLRSGPDAVVVAKDAQLVQSPVPQAKPVRGLPEGTAFRAGRVFGDWVEVTRDGRGAGWVARGAVVRIAE